jgi:hypothetical protein
VVDAFHRLFDDRALVQIAGDEVGGRTDQLDTAFMSLRIRACAFETRQKTVVGF